MNDQAEAAKNRALYATAIKYYQQLADKGDPEGQFRLGEMYRDGKGFQKDETKALELFSKSAAQGNKNAILALEKLNTSKP